MGRLSRLLSGVSGASGLSRCAYSVRAGTIVSHGLLDRRSRWLSVAWATDRIAGFCCGREVGQPCFADCKPTAFEGL